MTDSTPEVRRLANNLAGMFYRQDKGLLTGRNSTATDEVAEYRVKQLQAAMADLPDTPAGQKLWDRAEKLVRRYYGLYT